MVPAALSVVLRVVGLSGPPAVVEAGTLRSGIFTGKRGV
jgi:hypothetical protein